MSLSVVVLACLIGLGIWQVERRSWKLALIDRVEQRLHAPATVLPPPASWPKVNAQHDEYRHVVVSGEFLHDRESLVAAVTRFGGGYWVMTPLQTADHRIVLVNRGFVPLEKRDTATRREGNPSGPVEVRGLLRISEPGGGFLRHNDPEHQRWYSRDVAAIAAARGLPETAPFFLDADDRPNRGGWPVGGLTVVQLPNNHLVYALTWFGLAAMLAFGLLAASGRFQTIGHYRLWPGAAPGRGPIEPQGPRIRR